MKPLYKKIALAFSKLGINLNSSLTEPQNLRFAEGATNRYFEVKDSHGNRYLVRINGQLWPPFNREDEDRNLKQLGALRLISTVIYNDPENGFQICKFSHEKSKFTDAKNKNALLYLIGVAIKNYHAQASFNNHCHVSSILQSSFTRLPTQQQIKLNGIYQLILRMVLSLMKDSAHFVASHNDLLASSVYCEAGEISIVDWEYSGRNHRAYDLAFFSVKAVLSTDQENILIRAYDPNNALNIHDSISLMKPLVNFLLLLWSENSNYAYKQLILSLQHAVFYSSTKTLSREQILAHRLVTTQRHQRHHN